MSQIDNINFKVINLISAEIAHKYRVIPMAQENGSLTLFAEKEDSTLIKELGFILGKEIVLVPANPEDLKRHLSIYYPHQKTKAKRSKADLKEDSDVIRFTRKIMEEAMAIQASDIHIERYETFARVRFRWEGQLIEKYEIPLNQYNALVSRIKILAELDISERRLPQDGRIHIEAGKQKVDIRVSTIPAKYGEKVVMRLLQRNQQFLQLENLGMPVAELERFKTALRNQNGIILITGPTGSGKTTSLYAALSLLNQADKNIITVEDPIEYNIEGINQLQVKEDIGLSFGSALRAYLRQDPDIIMVGEIRDQETAEIAIRAALTGHLVFSTLHTNSSWDAVTRLIDMGIEPYLLAASLRMVMAQRLIRKLCHHCKTESHDIPYQHIREKYGISSHHEAEGCEHCYYTGYERRVAVYELVPLDKALSEKIKKLDLDIDDYLEEKGYSTIRQHVIDMIRNGETSLEEGLMYLI